MNIIEAMEWSRENGLSVSRSGCGWIRYGDNFMFRLSGLDLLANDWRPTAEYIEQLTGGKFEHVETDSDLRELRWELKGEKGI